MSTSTDVTSVNQSSNATRQKINKLFNQYLTSETTDTINVFVKITEFESTKIETILAVLEVIYDTLTLKLLVIL